MIEEEIRLFSNRLRGLMYERQVTAQSLSRMTGIGVMDIIDLMKGEREPTSEQLNQLGNALNVEHFVLTGFALVPFSQKRELVGVINDRLEFCSTKQTRKILSFIDKFVLCGAK